MSKSYLIIDNETDEIVCENASGFLANEDQNRKDFSYGNRERFFWHFFYENIDFPDLSPLNAFRLMYVSTFISYKDYCLKKQGKSITRKSLQELMGLRTNTFLRFIQDITDVGYIVKGDKGRYYLNSNFFKKGSLDKSESEVRHIRVYSEPLKALYKSIPQSKYGAAGYIIKLIPYINKQWNIICSNPFESERDKIDPLTMTDICGILGYNKTCVSKLKKELYSLTFTYCGIPQSACLYTRDPDTNKKIFVINPVLMYSGFFFSEVQEMCSYFRT